MTLRDVGLTQVTRETERAPAPARAKQAGTERVRADIQGLRALAVLAVLLHHLSPKSLGGGYVGVDVFFVLSGFLITTHLLQRPPTSARRVVEFWGRRIRRLLPAATVVLVVTLLASLVWLPQSMLPRVAREAVASALYSENWVLAGAATDYLGSQEAPSPFQHFWSLSVEEQFYLIWPLWIGALFLMTRRTRRRRPALVKGLGGLFLASLAWSVYLTSTDPSRAYFVTPTRMWELALGGLVALLFLPGVEPPRRWVRLVAAWVGLAMIGYAAMAFSTSTSFPGMAALVPTVGTGLVILADSDGLAGSPRALLANRASQYLGGISYSVYLWHWPLIVVVSSVLGRNIPWPQKIALGMLAVALGALTTRWVEDPIRRDPRLISNLVPTFAVAVVCVGVVLAGGSAMAVTLNREVAASAALVAGASGDGGLQEQRKCLGAEAIRSTSCASKVQKLLTTPLFARGDQPEVVTDRCRARRPFTARPVCTFGPKDAKTNIALMGNSHAGHWQPALLGSGHSKSWKVTTYLINECYPADAPISFPKPKLTANCQDWTSWAVGQIKNSDMDLVVTSSRTLQPLVGVPQDAQREQAKEAYARTFKELTSDGIPVLVIRDVPGMTENVPDCLDAHDQDVRSCSRPAKEAIPVDPAADAAAADRSGLVSVVDVNRLLCPQGECRSVIGGVIVFSDHGHLTKTYARTLAPEITAAVRRRLG